MRALRTSATFLIAALVLVGCANSERPSDAPATAATAQTRTADVAKEFSASDTAAITYKPDLVPVGASVAVSSRSGGGSSTVTLTVTGLEPDHHYGAHAHSKPCGAAAADSGPHFQNKKDPVTPSVDPAFANPQNEIWLDLSTGGSGAASATSTVAWDFTDAAAPKSVVVHANHTSMEPGKAGTAGDRLACVNVAF
ncbi:superoxide dismutase family protein [Pseudonocardia sp. N23]|uniref:superoxide dismutase family protein n=1 Tax=Pseudonocardia sp. N23 TaxID=1987376 RepID=UPI000BFC3157|nr:superoxide dismutase family protein [Pseudonocardia sp. N23]